MCRKVKVEEWRDIPGFDGFYQASDWGRIRSFYRNNGGNDNIPKRADRPHFLKRTFTKAHGKKGQAYVVLKRNGVRTPMTVGQAVASAFFGELPSGAVVCHKDGDTTNDCLWNLEIRDSLTQFRMYARNNFTKQNRTPVVKIDRNLLVIDAYPSIAAAARANGFRRGQMWKFCAMQIQFSVFAPDDCIYTYDDSAHIREAMRRAMTELDALGARYNDPGTERYYDLEPEETPELDGSAQWEDAPPLVGGGTADIEERR